MALDSSGCVCYPSSVADLSEVGQVIESLERYYLTNVQPARPLRCPL